MFSQLSQIVCWLYLYFGKTKTSFKVLFYYGNKSPWLFFGINLILTLRTIKWLYSLENLEIGKLSCFQISWKVLLNSLCCLLRAILRPESWGLKMAPPWILETVHFLLTASSFSQKCGKEGSGLLLLVFEIDLASGIWPPSPWPTYHLSQHKTKPYSFHFSCQSQHFPSHGPPRRCASVLLPDMWLFTLPVFYF